MYRVKKVQYRVSIPMDDHMPIEKARQFTKKELTRRIAEMLGDLLEFTGDIDWQYNARIVTGTLRVVEPDPNYTIELAMPGKTQKGSCPMVTFDICGGNPGALSFVMEAYKVNPFGAEKAFQRMQDNDITGTKLYMLWNDCCGRDTERALMIMKNVPIDKIVEHINYDRGRGYPFDQAELESLAATT